MSVTRIERSAAFKLRVPSAKGRRVNDNCLSTTALCLACSLVACMTGVVQISNSLRGQVRFPNWPVRSCQMNVWPERLQASGWYAAYARSKMWNGVAHRKYLSCSLTTT